ncbi:ATP-binding cassette domain-containing protein [Nocardia anaemiae]|uniref:ATP-binding cassette domain-containing protein n=1 Tax=Nocardia anaemiae TaxID=263910 RepID=UPI000AF70480|nr:ATP-binding cassette domain-containing protein [Nocardia anaemiae]
MSEPALLLTTGAIRHRISGRTHSLGSGSGADISVSDDGPAGQWLRFRYVNGWAIRAVDPTIEATLDDEPIGPRTWTAVDGSGTHELRIVVRGRIFRLVVAEADGNRSFTPPTAVGSSGRGPDPTVDPRASRTPSPPAAVRPTARSGHGAAANPRPVNPAAAATQPPPRRAHSTPPAARTPKARPIADPTLIDEPAQALPIGIAHHTSPQPDPTPRQQVSSAPGSWSVPSDRPLAIGRAGGDAEIALPGLDLAHRHATVRWTGRAVELRGLATNARPFVDGKPVLHARLRVGEQFMLAHHTFEVSGPAQLTLVPAAVIAREPLLRFDGVSLRYRGRTEPTLRDLTFELGRGEVLAVIGPSGAGKSTMCSGLLGEVALAAGSLRLGRVDLVASRMQASHLVSFVPQQPAMFGDLAVRDALLWVAGLRTASDTTRSERAARVDTVIAEMELAGEIGKRIVTLSGGQRKRVSTAMELLSDPQLLVLDEPTSGLDEGLDRAMMQRLRVVAETGCAVIVVTHSMVNVDCADKVLAVTGRGRLGFFGPPRELLGAFGVDSYAEVMDRLRADRQAGQPAAPSAPQPAEHAVPAPMRGSLHRHLPRLIGREWARQRNGFRTLALGSAAGIGLTAMLGAAASDQGLGGDPRAISSVMIALIVCLTFFSMAQSFAAIVDDRVVIEREARWGISAASVVLARAITCTPLAVLLGVASTIGYLGIKSGPANPILPQPYGLLLFAITLPLAAMALGLLVSACSKSLRQAVFVLMGVLALQVVMTGLAPPFEGTPGAVLRIFAYAAPSRWAAAGLGADIGLTGGADPPPGQQKPFADSIWTHDLHHVETAAAVLVVIAIVATASTIRVLRRQLMAMK